MNLSTFAHDEVHVWTASLDPEPRALRRLEQTLSDDEHLRAERFRFERHRRRYIAGRALLRTLLGGYLQRRPGEIEFGYGPYGKPYLLGDDAVSFNLAHSGDRALYALGRNLEIGVDVELMRREPARHSVPEHFFAHAEVAKLRALPDELQTAAFLRCWTRKEAYMKARGEGMALPLHDFEVTLTVEEAPALVSTAWSRTEPREWSLYDLSESCPGCAAAMAHRGGKRNIVIRTVKADLVDPRREER